MTDQTEKRASIALWPAGTPGVDVSALELETLGPGRIRNIRNPSVVVYEPPLEHRNGTGIVVCPGGGYDMVSCANEGFPVAEWLNRLGVCTYVLKYRLPNTHGVDYRHPVPLSDLQRAIRLVRGSAVERGLRADRIGVMGFSAGGHLAAAALTLFREPVHCDPVSCRPDFGVLVYPVISFTDDTLCHAGSRKNLIGADADMELRRQLTASCQVGADTPPIFLAHARNDGTVPCRNSELLHSVLRERGVATELHIYEQGGHGFGLGDPIHDVSRWPIAAEQWMLGMGLLPSG